MKLFVEKETFCVQLFHCIRVAFCEMNQETKNREDAGHCGPVV